MIVLCTDAGEIENISSRLMTSQLDFSLSSSVTVCEVIAMAEEDDRPLAHIIKSGMIDFDYYCYWRIITN